MASTLFRTRPLRPGLTRPQSSWPKVGACFRLASLMAACQHPLTPLPSAAGGLTAAYYENVWFFYTPVVVTVDPQINFNWGTGLITPTGADYISIRWSGKLKTPYAEAYTFYTSTDDGVRLWVDNVPLIDRWDSYTNDTSATIALKANVFYAIKMEYKELTGNAYATLSWSSPSTPKEIVPASQLYYETHAVSSPFSTQVVPALTCAVTSVASGDGLAKATAGTASQFTIQANDEYSNERLVGGDTFSVRCYPPSTETGRPRAVHAVVVDDTDSTYAVEYTPYVSTGNTVQAEFLKGGGFTATTYTISDGSSILGSNPNLGTVTKTGTATTVAATPPDMVFASSGAMKLRVLRGFLKPTSDGVATFTLITTAVGTAVTHNLVVDGKALSTVANPTVYGFAATASNIVGTLDLRSSNFYEIVISIIAPSGSTSSSATLSVTVAGAAMAFTANPGSNSYEGFHILGSPFAVTVSPARTSAAQSQAYISSLPDSLLKATAGAISQFTITARDLYTNLRAVGGEAFKVRLTGVDSTAGYVYDNGDGTYRVTYTTSKSGTYDISVVFGSSGVIGSPFRIAVEPASRHLPASIVTGTALTLATAGIYAHVTLTIKDAFDNWQPNPSIMTESTVGFSLTDGTIMTSQVPSNTVAGSLLCGTPVAPFGAADCPKFFSGSLVAIPTTADKPTMVMHYIITKSGVYSMKISGSGLNDGSVKNSPFPATVFPHIPCASTSTAVGSALSLVTAGRAAAFTVQARDMFFNKRGSQVGDNYAAFFRAPGQASAMNTVYVTTSGTGGAFLIPAIANLRGGGAITATVNVDPSQWTYAAKAPFAVGDAVTFSGTLPSPLVAGQVYFVRTITSTTGFTIYDANKGADLAVVASTAGVTFTAKLYEGLPTLKQNPLLGRDHRATVTDNGDSTYTLQFMPTQSETNQLHSYLGYKGGLMATYYTNQVGPINDGTTANVQQVLAAAGLGATSTLSAKNRLRFNGLIRPSNSGTYSFRISSSVAASTTAFSVDNMNIATATLSQGIIDVTSNSFYDILIDLQLTEAASAAVTMLLEYSLPLPAASNTWFSMPTGSMYVAFHTLGSPFAVAVAAAPTCAAASTKEAQSISLSTAGQLASFTIQARDQYGLAKSSATVAAGWLGNLRDGSGDAFDFALMSGATVPAVGLSASYYPSQDSSKDAGLVAFQGNVSYSNLNKQPGGYQVQYLATAGGMYQLRGKLMQAGGLYAEYFENNDLTDNAMPATAAFNRVDPTINFSWLDQAPASTAELAASSKKIGADYFSARWLGMVQPQFSEVHTFSLVADDGVKLWVDGLLIINFWSRRNLEAEGTIALMGGQLYNIKLEYMEMNGNATCILKWRSVSQNYEVISSSRLYYSTTSGRLSRTQLYVEPSVVCASTSLAAGPGLTIATAGIKAKFTIQAFDEYGNMRKMGDSPDFKVRIVPISDASQRPYHANLNHRWSTSGIQRIPSAGTFPGGLTATYYNNYCLGSLLDLLTPAFGSCALLWDKIHTNPTVKFVTCMQRPWDLQTDQTWIDSTNSAVLKNANQAVCGYGLGGSHSPYLSWNAGVDIFAQKMNPDYTSSSASPSVVLREKLFPSSGSTGLPFSARWSGYFQPSQSGLYSFQIVAATASVRLVLNAIDAPKLIIATATSSPGALSLISNALYEIEMSYSPTTELAAAPVFNLQYSIPGPVTWLTLDDKKRLYPLAGRYRTDYTPTVKAEYSVQVGVAHPGALDATFYSDADLSIPSATLKHTTVDFSSVPYFDNTRPRNSLDVGFGATSLDDGNSFSARWQGFYLASTAVSTFTVTVGGPDERVRLWIDNRLIIDRWDTYTDVQAFTTSWSATYDVSVPLQTAGEQEALLTAVVAGGIITALDIINPGVSYSMVPKLSTSGCTQPSTTLAELVATISGGVITAVQIVGGGTNYICTPSIQISGGRDFVWSSSANSLLDIKLEYKQLGAAASIKLQANAVDAAASAIPSTSLFMNREIRGSPFPPMSVQPAPTCASKSSVRGQGLTSATAGVPSMFTIQSNDQYFNERGLGGDLYLVRLQVGGPTFGCQEIGTCPIVYGTVIDNGDSSYSVTYNITRRGTYNVVTSLAVPGGLTATYYAFPVAELTTPLALAAGNSQPPDMTLWQMDTGDMIASKTAVYGIRLEGFVSPPASTVTFTFSRAVDMTVKRMWFNTHMGTRSETPAAGHGCWLTAPASSGVYNLPTCTNDYNGPTIATAFSANNAIIVSNLVINAMYDIKIELGHAVATSIGVQWLYGPSGSVTAAAANIPSSRLWARYDVPNGNWVATGTDSVTFSTAAAAVPNPWHFYLAHTLFVEQTDPATCTVTGDGLTIVTAGWTASFTITAKDSFANERFLSEDVFLVQMVSPANDVATLRAVPDTRPVRFPATSSAIAITAWAAGTITAGSALTEVVTGTPVTFNVNGAPSSDFKSGVTYFVERTPVAGVANTFTVSAYPGGPPMIAGTVIGSFSGVTATFQLARQGAGRYSVAFSVTASGYYSVNVLRGMTSGLTAQYFNNMWLLGTPALSTVDPSVNFNWGASTIQPAQGSGSVVLGSDYMSVRWSGYIMPELAETYTFYASADEGMRLRVDSKLLIDQWDSASSNYSATWYGGSVGALYSISFEYRESTLSAFAFLEYATASIARQVIPQEVLFSKAQHVYGSPFKLYALPAILCATTSTLTGPGLSFGTTGNTASFTIQAKDQYSNPKTFWHETCTFTGYTTTGTLSAVATSGRLVVGSKFSSGGTNTVTALGSCAAGNVCSYTISPGTNTVSCTQAVPCTASDQDNAFFVARTRDATPVSWTDKLSVNADYGKFATIAHNNVPGKFNAIFTATKMGASAVYTSYMNLEAAKGLMATYYYKNLPVSTAKISTLSDDVSAKWGTNTDGYSVRYSGIMFATAAGWYSFGINQGVACSGSDHTRILMINNKIVLSDTCPASLAVQPTSTSTPVQANVANTLFDVVFTMSVPVGKPGVLPGTVSISAQTTVAAATIGAAAYPVYCEFPVSRSPYNVTVRPDVTSYAISTITGLALTIATAGVTSQYTITSKDAAGNIRDSQGDTYLVYAASATGASFAGTIGYLSGGLYVVQYTATAQGAYVLKTYLGSADKTTALTVYPGTACASLSLANSKYLSVSTAGYISEFSVQCKDSYNNLRTVAVDKWIVRLKGNSSTNSEEQHDARVYVASVSGGSQVYQLGRYTALYRTTKSGAFAVNVMLVNTQGLNATYYRDLLYTNVAYNAIEFNTADLFVTSWGLGTPNSQVGVVDNWSVIWSGYLLSKPTTTFVTFKMLVPAITDKARLWIDDRFIIDQNTATILIASLSLNSNMMYDIKVYYANPSGTASVRVQWSTGSEIYDNIPSNNLFAAASHVKGSPFSATVFPAITCGTRSIGSGDGLSLATAGIAASFTITAFDHLGNVCTKSDDVFVVRARANVHNNKQAIDSVTAVAGTVGVDDTPTSGVDAFLPCAPTITLAGGGGAAVTMTSGGTITGCKAVTVTINGGTCTSFPKIIPLYTTLGILSGFQLENGGYCTGTLPTVAVAHAADILGTVISLGNGMYSVSYTPTLKRNDAATFHDLAVSQAVAGGLMATYYTGTTPKVPHHVRSKQTAFQILGTQIAASIAPSDVYPAVTPTTMRAMGFFKPAAAACTFTLAQSTLKAQINGIQYTGTASLTGLQIDKLYDIRFELTGAHASSLFAADATCIPDVSTRYFALHDLAFNTFRGDGLYATYYAPAASPTYIQDANLDWSGVSRTDRPYPSIPYDTASTGGAFAARWFGFVKPSRRDRYTFFIQAVNPTASSLSLYVDGVLVLANAGTGSGNALVEFSGTIQFPKASAWYTIEMKYAVAAGIDARGFKLSWANDGYSLSAFADTFVPPMSNETVPKQVVPSNRLTRAITQQFVADSSAAMNSAAAKVIDGTSGVSRDDYAIWNAMSPWSKTNDCEGSGAVAVGSDVCTGCDVSANITYIDQTRYRKCRGQGYQANDILRVDVKPAIACSSKSVVQVDTACPTCLTVTTAGVARSFQLTVRDAWGNIRDSMAQALVSRLTLQTGLEKPFVGGVSFYASGTGPRAVTATDPLGRYMVSYTITRSGIFNNDVSLADVRGNGMYGTYFVNVDLTGGSVTQLDANINFNWGVAAPLASGVIPANYFSVRWTGLIRPVFSELYTFYILADEVARVYVDNTLIIDRWNSTSGVEYAGTYLMVGNVIFDIKVEYADFDNNAYVTLSYSSPSTPKDVIPNSVLFPALDLLSSSTYGGGRNTLTSWPAVTCATTSTVNGAGLTIATAGIAAAFTIQSYDQYGNTRPSQDSSGSTGSSPPTVSTADCAASAVCNWRVRIVPDTVSATTRSNIGVVTPHIFTTNSLFAVAYTYTLAGAHTVSTSYLKSTQQYTVTPLTGGGLAATYYDDTLYSIPTAAMTGVTLALTGGTILTDQVPSLPFSSGLKNDNLWSARYAGHILTSATATELTFLFTKTTGESVKLWVDDVPITISTTATSAAAQTTFAVTVDNMYPIRIEFITVSGGAHTLSLALTGGTALFPSWDVSGSTKRLRINPAVASSTKSSFKGVGLTLATSGVQALFTVSCRDAFDNLRAIGGDLFVARAFPAIPTASYGAAYAPSPYATAWGTTQGGDFGSLFQTGCTGCPALVRASVTDVKDNTYIVAFTPTKKGIYKVVASLARVGSLSAFGYNAAPSTDTVVSGDYNGVVGFSVDFSTTSYSAQSPFGGLGQNSAFIRWQGFIQPSKAAQYTFSVNLKGLVVSESVTLWIDNTRVLSVTGNAQGTASATFGFGLANALYDIHVTFASRTVASGAGDSGVTLSWESLGSFAASDNVIKATVPTSRLYSRQDVGNSNSLNPTNTPLPNVPEPVATVTHSGTGASTVVAIGTNGLALTVHASIGCATKSVSTGNYLSLATAGGVAIFSISGRDSYQNDRTKNSDMPFTVSLYGSGGSPTIQAVMTASTTAGSNLYTSKFTANVALSYDVFVKYANDNVFGSPYSLVVKPGTECATKTTITGSGLTAATVNSQAYFTIQSRDSFGNARTQALSNSNPSAMCAPTVGTMVYTSGILSTCPVTGTLTNCDGVPLIFLGGVLNTGGSPAVAILSTTIAGSTYCNILNPGSYSTNPTAAIVQSSAFVTRVSYTNNGPIHEIGNPVNAVLTNTQPKVLNSLVTYTASATAGMQNSAGMYTGIYTLTSAPVAMASYFIPTMAVKGTMVATYYTGTFSPAVDSATDLDTASVTVCFSGDRTLLFFVIFL